MIKAVAKSYQGVSRNPGRRILTHTGTEVLGFTRMGNWGEFGRGSAEGPYPWSRKNPKTSDPER
jgi:hypothetical protein